jgi:tetratricopeptide (TPR) repeat protein
MSSDSHSNPPAASDPLLPKRKYVRAVGPRLRLLLGVIFGLFALLGANSVYLASITFLEWFKGLSYQNYFYMVMFGAHLALGLLLIVPVVIFGIIHARNSYDRPNRRAVRVGYSLFICSLILLISGVALMRFDFFSIKNPNVRSPIYWAHVITPLIAMWLYVLHRLAGPRIKWQIGVRWAAAVGVLVLGSVALHSKHPKKSEIGSKEGEKYFQPSQARTATGKFIPAETLMMDDYCKKCHEDAYQGWFHSSHRFSSFNNPAYLFSIKETREVSMKRTGSMRSSRWCAGCHDVVPLFSGAFDDPNFDMQNHPTANAGITCTACHSITHINSTIGNSAYTIEEPIHYPFASSTNDVLQWVNNVLVKAKPDFHKKTFLKPFMKSAEYCSVCHKVSLPAEVTHYKEWLRGQNHYDSHLLSGGSGHGARSFYYPPKSEPNCNGCHMPLKPSEDFAANFFNPTNSSQRYIHDHLFPSANTALPYLRGDHDIVKEHDAFGTNTVRVDIFALKEGGTIDSPILAPLRPTLPTLKRGQKYLLEIVLRTTPRLAHHFSQGTVDSNEIWVDLQATSGGRTIARSGGLGPHGEVDEWSHFVNVYMLDKDGNRIDRRNAQDIFTPLYNNQIPPGSGQVVHYEFTVPPDLAAPLDVQVQLKYRKFDTLFVNYFMGTNHQASDPFRISNSLPIRIISSDRLSLPVESAPALASPPPPSSIPEWMRWNDYGIGLLNKGDKGSEKGELIQATYAFEQVERLGRADGPVNLARVYFKEGRLEDAVEALQRAGRMNPPPPRWTVAWFSGLVNKQNGYLDKAITEFKSILEDRYPELDQRGFDFSKDYEVLNELGQTLFERAKMERGEARKEQREGLLRQAMDRFQATLALDSENLTAHYNLALIHAQLGNTAQAAEHRRLHEKYRPDDNARDRAVTIARRNNPAADHAAQAIVIYPSQRPGAFGLPSSGAAPIKQQASR